MGNLKPLNWAKWCDGYQANTPFGSFTVEPKGSGWEMSYCFDECYDEHNVLCDDEETAKATAWNEWMMRMKDYVVNA